MKVKGRSLNLCALRKDLKVVVVDYGSGNLRSVSNALEKASVRPLVSSDPHQLLSADAAVLPGVGAGNAAMHALHQRDLVDPLREFITSDRPFMGVCLGLQLLVDSTSEGNVPCLGIIPGTVKHLPTGLKIPHMGWNLVRFKTDHPIFQDIPQESYFYFVHSYYADIPNSAMTVGVTNYSITFSSVLAHRNLIATQFHPEKSGPLGLKIYRDFVKYAALAADGNGELWK